MNEFEELPSDELFPDEHELKKENTKLKRQLNKFREEQAADTKKLIKQHERALLNTVEFYNEELEKLRDQVRELFERNLELHETSKIFVKGLEHLKRDGIRVTQTHFWSRKGVHGSLEHRINQLSLDNKRVIFACATKVDHHGEIIEAVIATEHFDKHKKPS